MKKVVWCTAIIGVGIIVVYIVLNRQYMTTNDSNTIISFAGNLIGAVITGLITFMALYFTIQHEKKQFKSDKAIQLLPYLSFAILRGEDKKGPHIFRETVFYSETPETKKEGMLRGFDISLAITNVGLGTAIKVHIQREVDSKTTDWGSGATDTSIRPDEAAWGDIYYTVDSDVVKLPPLSILCSYENMLGDFYEQKIEISFYDFQLDDSVAYRFEITNETAPISKSKA